MVTTLAEKESLQKIQQFYNSSKEMDDFYSKMDFYQLNYWKSFDDHKIVCIDEKAGTGKTQVAVHKALSMLREKEIDCIHYVRFPSKRSQQLGALPGDIEEKEHLYMQPFYECLQALGLNDMMIECMEKNGKLITSTDLFMRGTTMKGTFLIIDESQNAVDLATLKLVLTRINDSRGATALIGHSGQLDNHVKTYTKHQLNAFQVYTWHLCRRPWATRCQLVNNYRGEVSQWSDRVEESLSKLELTEF